MIEPRRLAALLLVATLALGTSACSGSDDEAATEDPAPAAATDEGTDVTGEAPDGAPDEAAEPEGNPGEETLVDGPAEADKTVTWTGTAFEPSALEVAPGEVFTFVAGTDAGTAAVTFDGNDSYTITTGLTESFTLDVPGTYTVSEFISEVPMTVTVTG